MTLSSSARLSLPADGAEELAVAAGAVFARDAADIAADFFAVAEARPVHDFQAGGERGELAQAVGQRHGARSRGLGREPGVQFEDLGLEGQVHGALRCERLSQPVLAGGAELRDQARPHLFAPPAFRKIEQPEVRCNGFLDQHLVSGWS